MSRFSKLQFMLGKYRPEILTGIGVTGMFTMTMLAVTATPKALVLLEERKRVSGDEVLTKKTVIKTVYKCYIPAAITGLISVGCIVGASSVNLKRNAALTAAYTLSEGALRTYQDKVIEVIGEKKEKTVREEVAKANIAVKPVSSCEVYDTKKGTTLCYDVMSSRYFKSDFDMIIDAKNRLNERLLTEMFISINEFYWEIGLTPLGIGDDIGWNLDEGLIEFDKSSILADNGTPCLVIDSRIQPKWGFHNRS